MDCEVVVVGGGIGGLTVAALLAKRGVDVCLLERESRVGGCAASFEKFGYRFEQGDGLYSAWQRGEIHEQIFSELGVESPEVRRLQPGYEVRLPDGEKVSLSADTERFEENLRQVFPECAEAAIGFFREVGDLNRALSEILRKTPDFLTGGAYEQTKAWLSAPRWSKRIAKLKEDVATECLADLSPRLRDFIDIQLQFLAQGSSAQVSYLYAATVLAESRDGMFAIRGGAAALADTLANSIRSSGGRIRLDTPVLRLSYDSSGTAIGVDLLSGETVTASKAIISNLTIWDTYGKLVGLNRTPTEYRKTLKSLKSWGAYLIYVSIDESLASSLASTHYMLQTALDGPENNPADNQLLLSIAPSWDTRGPAGKRAGTVHALTDVDEWFTFHRDETEAEEQDERMLEVCWTRLHGAMPELGGGVEVIDTATPRTFYDSTRRKLGMVGGLAATPAALMLKNPAATFLPNLFIVSDTLATGRIAGVSRLALQLTNHLTGR